MALYDVIDEDKIRRSYTERKQANYQARQGGVRGGQADINQSMKDRVRKATGGGAKPKPKPSVKAGQGLLSKTMGFGGKLLKFGNVAGAVATALTPSEIAGEDVSGREAIGSVPNQQTPEQIEAQKKFGASPYARKMDAEFLARSGDIPPTEFERDVAGADEPSVRGANIGAEPYQTDYPTVATDPQLMQEGAEVQPSTIPEGAGAVRGGQYDYITDTPFQPGETGGMRLYSGADALNDPQAKDLARQAAAGEINTAQYNAGLRSIRQAQESGQGRGGDNASRLADNISRIEGELARPGRGANQSLNDMLTEARTRKNKRRALDELYKLQGQRETTAGADRRTEAQAESAAADRTSREKIAEQKDIVARNKATRAESVRTEQQQYERAKYREKEGYDRSQKVLADESASAGKKATAMKDATKVYWEDAKNDPKLEGNRPAQTMRVAKMQMSHVKPGDPYFTTPEGRIARRDTSKQLHSYMSSERGLVDWIANIPGMVGIGKDDRYSQEDIENMDFSSFNIDDAGEGAYVFRSTIRNAEGEHSEYAYQHSMNPEFVSVMRKLIANDKAKKRQTGVRATQQKVQRDTAEYIRSQ